MIELAMNRRHCLKLGLGFGASSISGCENAKLEPPGYSKVALRLFPLSISARDDLKDLAPPKEVLRAIRRRLEPFWNVLKLGEMTHWLRYAGVDSPSFKRGDRKTFSGEQMLRCLLDSRVFRNMCGFSTPSLLNHSDFGIAVRYHAIGLNQEGVVGHVDAIVRLCSELSIASDFPVFLDTDERFTIGDMLRDSLARLDDKQELPWTCESLARYVSPPCRWKNRFGDVWSVNRLAGMLASQQTRHSSCLGSHDPYALIVALRADQDEQLLSDTIRTSAMDYLIKLSRQLTLAQRSDGSYVPATSVVNQKEMDVPLIWTGHHLEWISLADGLLSPDKDSIRSAINWLTRHLGQLPELPGTPSYLPATHAAAAIENFANVRFQWPLLSDSVI